MVCLAGSADVRFMELYRSYTSLCVYSGGANPLMFRKQVLALARQVRAAAAAAKLSHTSGIS